MMCFMMGHGGALGAIFVLLVSTAFLIWVAGKTGNPMQKFGRGIGWIAFVLTAIITICSLVCQAKMCMSGGCGSGKKGCGMMGGGKGMSEMMMMHQMMGEDMMKQSDEKEKK